METPLLMAFFERVKEDNRMTTTHISLYMVLWVKGSRTGFSHPVSFTRREAMEAAKISGLATYHKCIKDLAALGYIEYYPSFNPYQKSRVLFR